MEERSRFKIVFEKLAEARRTEGITEAEEIDELRRVVSEITEPEPKSFTTT
jgi:polyhydroxyalkanoate synthesis regulator phasin